MTSANIGLSARKPCGQNRFFQKVTLMAHIGNISTTERNLGMEKWQKPLEWSRGEDGGLHEDINKANGWEKGSGRGKGQSPSSTGQWLGVLRRFLAMVRKAAEGNERGRNSSHVLLMNHLTGKVLQGQGSHMICYGRCWARCKTHTWLGLTSLPFFHDSPAGPNRIICHCPWPGLEYWCVFSQSLCSPDAHGL